MRPWPAVGRRAALALVSSVLLAACGGAAGPTPAAAAPPAVPEACTVRVQLFGDSTMWGWDGSASDGRRAGTPPGRVLQQQLDAAYGAGAVAIETRAVSGTVAVQLLDGSDGLNRPWPQSVQADIVVVNFGINDQRLGTPVADYAEQLLRFGTPRARLVFQTPLPTTDRTGDAGALFPQAMRDAAATLGAGLADAAAYAAAVPGWFGSYAPDGTHPNSAGYQALVTAVLAPTIRGEIRRARLCGLQ